MNPDQTPLNAASDQGLHYLPLSQYYIRHLHVNMSKMDLLKFYNKYGKEVRCSNI